MQNPERLHGHENSLVPRASKSLKAAHNSERMGLVPAPAVSVLRRDMFPDMARNGRTDHGFTRTGEEPSFRNAALSAKRYQIGRSADHGIAAPAVSESEGHSPGRPFTSPNPAEKFAGNEFKCIFTQIDA